LCWDQQKRQCVKDRNYRSYRQIKPGIHNFLPKSAVRLDHAHLAALKA